MLPAVNAWRNDGGGDISGRMVAAVAIVAVMALTIGVGAGVYLGRSAAPDLITLADQTRTIARGLSDDLTPARDEYATAVPNGAVTDPAVYAEAQARIARVRSGLRTSRRPLEALAPGAYGRAVTNVDALAVAAAEPATPDEIARLLDAALAELAALSGR